MAFLDTLKRILGLDAGTASPPAPPVPPAPRPPAPSADGRDASGRPDMRPPVNPGAPTPPPQPVAVITLRKGAASISTPGRDERIADAPYRRPTVVPNGTYTAQRQGGGIALSQGGTRVTTIYPNEQAGTNDLGLQFLMWQMLINQVDNDAAGATVRIDDLHGPDDRPDTDTDATPGPDTDFGDLDPSSPTQGEQDAAKALGVLGFESALSPVLSKEDPTPAATAPVEPPAPATPAPEPTQSPAPDSWTPSGAYER